eukprot:gene10892-14618_t
MMIIAVENLLSLLLAFTALQFIVTASNVDNYITTIAGNGSAAYNGNGGQATSATLYYPQYIALDYYRNIIIADIGNNVIRKVSKSNIISTVAGNGIRGYSGDGGPATSASISPQGVAVDTLNNIYITCRGYIRKVNTQGIITTIAGYGSLTNNQDQPIAATAAGFNAFGIAMTTSGTIIFADPTNDRIKKLIRQGYCQLLQ